ncbi:uncharacterized protein TrAFT101_009162 [Trichoderma asperellum]|uniref:uncharacterized protein n=1 Tax=Trichoderma asperellum TaxID=101201 RepID=UPI003330D288|nr:hypothetical protein TrAFT101_009162 [Trichoderma asperellum]
MAFWGSINPLSTLRIAATPFWAGRFGVLCQSHKPQDLLSTLKAVPQNLTTTEGSLQAATLPSYRLPMSTNSDRHCRSLLMLVLLLLLLVIVVEVWGSVVICAGSALPVSRSTCEAPIH